MKKKNFGEAKFENTTPVGERKDFSKSMSESYNPEEVEASWDSWWERQGLYKGDPSSKAEPFVVVIPPPNVTGTLHLGHALTCSIEDAIIRWNRMCGKNALWIPGTDHAGIATQVVVERKLQRERKQSRHDLGREKFLEEVWKWKNANGDTICSQLRKLGASVDWSRFNFTMDPKLCRAVTEAFVRMYNDGLIYRANRLVNWSCTLKTAISSIEVTYVELDGPTKLTVPGYKEQVEFGVLHSFAYPFVDGSGEIVVATTRMETMLGDVAVAVHPEDPRYKSFHGKKLKHPFIPDREVVLITDAELVNMEFGTGAVKITPGHDVNDFKCGERHKLPMINIFDDEGVINENGGPYQNWKRFEARVAIIGELTRLGLYRGKAPNPMAIGRCQRSNDVVEPVIRPQWWVNCKTMASAAVDAVAKGELEIQPAFHIATWNKWLTEIQDWCISRQLWWGHRIPAWFVNIQGDDNDKDDSSRWVVARSHEEALAIATKKYGGKQITLEQDPDVLDTWFSSGLFPFSVFGWPEETADLKAFYPTTLLETGHDILFFWVARMVMQGLHLTGRLPFKKVYLHAMVRDKFGRKMSKSSGNVIDPIDVIHGITLEQLHQKLMTGNLDPAEIAKATKGQKADFPDGIAQCGADALRFGLLAYTTQGRDINLDIQRVVAYRQFCNKLWNATKFMLLNFDPSYTPPTDQREVDSLVAAHGRFADLWIRSRLSAAVEAVNRAFEEYEFANATTAIYNFWLYDLCDVYLEVIKPVMRGETGTAENKAAALAVLYSCMEHGLLLLHPMMPFVTEELYHRLPGHQHRFKRIQQDNPNARQACGSIMVQPFPTTAGTAAWRRLDVEEEMSLLSNLVHAARSTRSSLGLARKKCDMYIATGDPKVRAVVQAHGEDFATLALATTLTLIDKTSSEASTSFSAPVDANTTLYLANQGLVDLAGELLKVEKQHAKLFQLQQGLLEKTSGSAYAAKTSEAVKQEHADKLRSQAAQLEALEESMKRLRAQMSPDQIRSYEQQKAEDLARAALTKQKKEESSKEKKSASSSEAKEPKEIKTKQQQHKVDKPKHQQTPYRAIIHQVEELIQAVQRF